MTPKGIRQWICACVIAISLAVSAPAYAECWRLEDANQACQAAGLQCPTGNQCSDDVKQIDPTEWQNLDPEVVKLLLLGQQDWQAILRDLGPLGVFIITSGVVGSAWAFAWWRVRVAAVSKWDGKCSRLANRRACKPSCPVEKEVKE